MRLAGRAPGMVKLRLDSEDKKPDDRVEQNRIVDESTAEPDGGGVDEVCEWVAPIKDNHAYRGDWSTQGIDSHTYKEIWVAKKISNREHVDDDVYSSYAGVRSLGFGWTGRWAAT